MKQSSKFIAMIIPLLLGAIYAYVKKIISTKILSVIVLLGILIVIFLYVRNKKSKSTIKKHKNVKSKTNKKKGTKGVKSTKKNKKSVVNEHDTPDRNIYDNSTEIPIYNGNNDEK